MKKKKSWLRENAEIVISAFIIAMLIRTFIAEPFKIPTGSMEPTLHGDPRHGDRIFANKFIYRFRKPDRGDVVVFTTRGIPGLDRKKKNYIKRLIGLPGETVTIKDNSVFIGGEQLTEPGIAKNSYVNSMPMVQPLEIYKNRLVIPRGFFLAGFPDEKRFFLLNRTIYPLPEKINLGDPITLDSPYMRRISYGPVKGEYLAGAGEQVEFKSDGFYVGGEKWKRNYRPEDAYIIIGEYGAGGENLTIPTNCYFVLGDNSYNSKDSRYWGFVPEKNLKGEAILIWWPPKRWQIVR